MSKDIETISISDGEKEYVFLKPDFEVKLYEIVNGRILGRAWNNNKEDWILRKWYLHGMDTKGTDYYSLTPLPTKKEWWECEENFPAMIINEEGDIELVRELSDWNCCNQEMCRLATKAEVNSLYCLDSEV